MLKQPHSETESQRIRNAFESFSSGVSTEGFALHLLDTGFWDDTELINVQVKFAQRKVNSALKEVDDAGLPYAIPSTAKTESGKPIWKQLDLCSFDDVEAQVQRLNVQELAVRENKQPLIRYAVRRWNRVPSVSEPEEKKATA